MPKPEIQRFLEFATLVHVLCQAEHCSVTSWHRTEKRNAEKGGLVNSFHLEGLAADLVPDNLEDRERIAAGARRLGLDAYTDAEHVHIELDYRH